MKNIIRQLTKFLREVGRPRHAEAILEMKPQENTRDPKVLVTVCKFRFYFYYFENMMKWLRKRRDKILSTCTKYSIVTVVLEGMTGKTKSQSPPHLQVPFTYFLVVTTYQRLIIWESGQHQFIGLYTERFYSVE